MGIVLLSYSSLSLWHLSHLLLPNVLSTGDLDEMELVSICPPNTCALAGHCCSFRTTVSHFLMLSLLQPLPHLGISCSRSLTAHYNFGKLIVLTLPTILYRLLKKAYHSSRTVLYLSSRSSQFGTQSSGFKLDMASPRDGSFPAKTVMRL